MGEPDRPIDEAVVALFHWTMGFVAARRTEWVVESALRIQRRFPSAFASRVAERSWYPRFIRSTGYFLPFCATVFTLEIAFHIWVRIR